MILREAIQQIDGFRFVVERLELSSPLGRRFLYESHWLSSREQVEAEYDRTEALCGILARTQGKARCERLHACLMQTKDIRATIGHVGESRVLDDLELFEVKSFALLAEQIRQIAEGWDFVRIPDLEQVIRLLDPEDNRIPQFYIYDVYSQELAAIRRTVKTKKQQGAQNEAEEAYARSLEVEDRVREELSVQLRDFHDPLEQALTEVAHLDVLLAKARQARAMELTRPQISPGDEMVFKGLFNPEIRDILRQSGKDFQRVDLRLEAGPTVITGANMAGKTVLLKSLALAQCMFQFGFFVPAAEARMVLMDELRMSVGDGQDERHGLSSYAAEMLRIHEIITRIKAGRRVLVLIDEPARTTNPVEGKALVNGIVELLARHRIMAVVTTHYSGVTASCRKLRVRGFVEERLTERVTLKNIDGFIDYSLLEDAPDEVPHEALRIARLLGVDAELIECAEAYLQGSEQTI